MCVNGIAALLLWSVALAAAPAALPPDADRVRTAIEAMVHARLGAGVTVSVAGLSDVRLTGQAGPLLATPDPVARIGAPARFVLVDGTPGRTSVRVGEATATVNVTADVVRTRRPIARGTRLGPDDVARTAADLGGRPLKPLPSLDESLGARAMRDLGVNAILGRGDIAAEPMIRVGDVVRARIRVGDVEVIATVIAAENGRADDVVRVVNRESRRTLRARVTGRGEVEVVDVR